MKCKYWLWVFSRCKKNLDLYFLKKIVNLGNEKKSYWNIILYWKVVWVGKYSFYWFLISLFLLEEKLVVFCLFIWMLIE